MSEGRTPELAAAYAFCRGVAKREAKNFYWAFRALPRHKSDAMCAVYAFMRKADDLADDESMTVEARRAAMQEWTAAWRASRSESESDPVFVALNDTQRRFGISDGLLEQLVAGTTMDLQPELEGTVHVRGVSVSDGKPDAEQYLAYESFDALYRYCYLVASVVGLVTIRIFGYKDPKAEELAEHTGIAFQLTNILRDVREDAERLRVYLPLSDLAESHASVEQVVLAARNGLLAPAVMTVLRKEIGRAQEFYKSGDELIPLIEKDSQPAMRVLISIYRRLLERIAADPALVFRERVSVPTSEKLAILGRGMVASMFARLG